MYIGDFPPLCIIGYIHLRLLATSRLICIISPAHPTLIDRRRVLADDEVTHPMPSQHPNSSRAESSNPRPLTLGGFVL